MSKKSRLDILMIDQGIADNLEQAQRLIMAGKVSVNHQVAVNASSMVARDANVQLKRPPPYVGRGGYKLEAAFNRFKVEITDLIAADIGASTGGFTDCLLQYGARKVYAIDVGYGQLDWSLRQNEQVIVMERVNARYLTADNLPELVDLVTIDVSFISLQLILPSAHNVLKPTGQLIALVKPQFEARREEVGKGGIVRDARVHQDVLNRVINWAVKQEFTVSGLMPSPIKGADGNVEFLLYLTEKSEPAQNADILIAHCMAEIS